MGVYMENKMFSRKVIGILLAVAGVAIGAPVLADTLWSGSVGGTIYNANSGNVGIGTSSPSALLEVNKSATGKGGEILLRNPSENTGNYVQLAFNLTNQVNYQKGAIAYVANGNFYGRGDLYFLQESNQNDTNAGLSNAAMVIKNNGNVGIGTTTPSQKLEVNGNFKLNGNMVSDGDICIGMCP